MASYAQSGLLQMLGPTQNMSIYRKRNGEYGLRRKGGPTAKRFAKDPHYEQARINTSEFGQAAKASALIRRAFMQLAPKTAQDEIHARLTRVCKSIINSDASHARGSRQLLNGDHSLFQGFNFYPGGKMYRCLSGIRQTVPPAPCASKYHRSPLPGASASRRPPRTPG